MKQTNSKTRSYWLLLFGIISVSTAAIMIRFAQRGASSLVISAYRMFFAAVIALVMWAAARSRQRVNFRRRNVLLMLLSGLFLALHFASWTTSLQYVSVSSSVILVTTTPLWVALLSPLVLKEKVTRQFYLGMAVAILGGVLIGLNESCALAETGLVCRSAADLSNASQPLGLFLALFGAWMAAGYMLIGRKLSAELDTVPYTAVVYSVAALLLIAAAILSGDPLTGYPPQITLLFLAMAIIPQTLGHSILNYSLQSLPATTVSLSLLGEPIGSSILAVIFLNEIPSVLEASGGILILLGIAQALWPARKANAV